MGRTARRSYDLDDVTIVPSRRTRSSPDVSTAWQIDAYRFDIPLLTQPTDAIVSPAMAVADRPARRARGARRRGAVGAARRPATGVAGRIARGGRRGRPGRGDRGCCRSCTRRRSASTCSPRRSRTVRDGRRHGRRPGVSPQHAASSRPAARGAGVEMLVIQGTIVSAEHVAGGRAAEPEDVHRRPGRPGRSSGGCANYQTATHLMRTGAAGVIVGYGARRRPRPPTRCWASGCRWPPRSPTRPRPGGPTWTRPAAATCT